MPFSITGKIDKIQHGIDSSGNLIFGHLFQLEAKRNVVENIQMGEQGIFLEHGVDPSLVGRNIVDFLSFKKQAAS